MIPTLYKIQVTDIRGNWVTLKVLSLRSDEDAKAELASIIEKRSRQSARAVVDGKRIVGEHSTTLPLTPC